MSSSLTSDQAQWPAELDALIAAPGHHILLFENESVRVLESRIPAGEMTPLHTHRWAGPLYLLSWSDFIRRDHRGAVLLDTRQASGHPPEGSAAWSPALPPHTFENVGQTEFRAITVELKSGT